MKKLSIIFHILIYAGLCSANDKITYTDVKKTIAITVDSSMSTDCLKDINSINPYALIAATDSDYANIITVQYSVNDSGAAKNHKRMLQNLLPDGSIHSQTTVTTNGVTGYLTYATLTYDQTYSYAILDFVKDKKHYIIMGWTYSKEFNKSRRMLTDGVLSFKILK